MNLYHMRYQPIFDRQKRIYGYEALYASIHNAEIFADAEPVFELDCFRSAIILAYGIAETLFVNLSLGALLAIGSATLAKYAFKHFRPGQVVIEITEHGRPIKQSEGKLAIKQAHSFGFKIALDDFGTGNTLWLLDEPIDFLKLNIALVQNLHRHPFKQRLISVLTQGDHIVIAEGVETKSEFESCYRAGVQLFQGYYLGKPGKLPSRIKTVGHK